MESSAGEPGPLTPRSIPGPKTAEDKRASTPLDQGGGKGRGAPDPAADRAEETSGEAASGRRAEGGGGLGPRATAAATATPRAAASAPARLRARLSAGYQADESRSTAVGRPADPTGRASPTSDSRPPAVPSTAEGSGGVGEGSGGAGAGAGDGPPAAVAEPRPGPAVLPSTPPAASLAEQTPRHASLEGSAVAPPPPPPASEASRDSGQPARVARADAALGRVEGPAAVEGARDPAATAAGGAAVHPRVAADVAERLAAAGGRSAAGAAQLHAEMAAFASLISTRLNALADGLATALAEARRAREEGETRAREWERRFSALAAAARAATGRAEADPTSARARAATSGDVPRPAYAHAAAVRIASPAGEPVGMSEREPSSLHPAQLAGWLRLASRRQPELRLAPGARAPIVSQPVAEVLAPAGDGGRGRASPTGTPATEPAGASAGRATRVPLSLVSLGAAGVSLAVAPAAPPPAARAPGPAVARGSASAPSPEGPCADPTADDRSPAIPRARATRSEREPPDGAGLGGAGATPAVGAGAAGGAAPGDAGIAPRAGEPRGEGAGASGGRGTLVDPGGSSGCGRLQPRSAIGGLHARDVPPAAATITSGAAERPGGDWASGGGRRPLPAPFLASAAASGRAGSTLPAGSAAAGSGRGEEQEGALAAHQAPRDLPDVSGPPSSDGASGGGGAAEARGSCDGRAALAGREPAPSSPASEAVGGPQGVAVEAPFPTGRPGAREAGVPPHPGPEAAAAPSSEAAPPSSPEPPEGAAPTAAAAAPAVAPRTAPGDPRSTETDQGWSVITSGVIGHGRTAPPRAVRRTLSLGFIWPVASGAGFPQLTFARSSSEGKGDQAGDPPPGEGYSPRDPAEGPITSRPGSAPDGSSALLGAPTRGGFPEASRRGNGSGTENAGAGAPAAFRWAPEAVSTSRGERERPRSDIAPPPAGARQLEKGVALGRSRPSSQVRKRQSGEPSSPEGRARRRSSRDRAAPRGRAAAVPPPPSADNADEGAAAVLFGLWAN